MECEFDPVLVSDTYCQYKNMNATNMLISFGDNSLKSQSSLFARVKNFRKAGVQFKDGIFDFTIDLCNFFETLNKNSFATFLVPSINVWLKQLDFHACPYAPVRHIFFIRKFHFFFTISLQGAFHLLNMSVNTAHIPVMLVHKYRTDLIIFNRKMETLMQIKFFGHARKCF
jgi:hypothetical protein